MLRPVRLPLAFCLLAGVATAAQAIPRKDVLECALPNGGRATLTARYEWSPLAEIIPADLSKRLNQESWQIRFEASGGRDAQHPPRSIPHSAGVEACSHIGIVDGVLLVSGSYLEPGRKWFDDALLPSKLLLYPATKSQPPEIRAQLQAIGAMPVLSYSLVLPRSGRLVFERPLINTGGND